MGFMKIVIIFQNSTTKVYINQCHNPGRKTRFYTVRRDDYTGLANLVGVIKWDWGWRQYSFYPEPNTKWADECMINIAKFLTARTKEERLKWKRKAKQGAEKH